MRAARTDYVLPALLSSLDCWLLPMALPSLTTIAHQWIASHVQPGQIVVDATAGNGYDTVFLADQVGPSGHVIAFDVQAPACNATRRRCEGHGVADHVTIVQAAMFNLGYLPGHDHTCITRPDTTCRALNATCELMTEGGLITVLAYRGHDGGPEEAQRVREWIDEQGDGLRVLQSHMYSSGPDAPILWGIQVPVASN